MKPPSYLDKLGRDHFKALVELLEESGNLQRLDADSIVASEALLRVIPVFDNKNVAAVTPGIHVKETSNILQHMQNVEYRLSVFNRFMLAALGSAFIKPAVNSTASTYVKFAFTSQYLTVGPGQYFACTQSNGTSDTIRMLVTGTQDTYLTTSKTGTFGTIPAITVPTTFTSAVGPYAYLY